MTTILNPSEPQKTTDNCEYSDLIADGYCDDGNNNPECNFDGGDCCGNNVKTDFCSDCVCMENICTFPYWATDEFCDDENNTPECNYDGGACCGDNVSKWFCSDCQCKEPAGEYGIL